MWHLTNSRPKAPSCPTAERVRNSVAAIALRRAGYDVVELDGSYAGWAAWQQTRETIPAS